MPDREQRAPYAPTTRRRFELSHDTLSHERVRALLDTYREMKEEVPFFAGLTLFGSLSKGKRLTPTSAQQTDIDLFVFFDRDAIQAHLPWLVENPDFQTFFQQYFMHSSLGKSLRKVASPEQLLHQYAPQEYVLSKTREKIIRHTHGSVINLENSIHIKGLSLQNDSPHSIYGWIQQNDRDLTIPGRIGAVLPQSYLHTVAPFFYDIGGGLRPYREGFLRKLAELPEKEGNRIWAKFVLALHVWERKGNIPTEIADTYPKTVAQAIEYYQPTREPAELSNKV